MQDIKENNEILGIGNPLPYTVYTAPYCIYTALRSGPYLTLRVIVEHLEWLSINSLEELGFYDLSFILAYSIHSCEGVLTFLTSSSICMEQLHDMMTPTVNNLQHQFQWCTLW